MKMTREEAKAAGVVLVPGSDYGHKLCHCGVCGETSVCTPSNDFYVRGGEQQLRCNTCVRALDDGRT